MLEDLRQDEISCTNGGAITRSTGSSPTEKKKNNEYMIWMKVPKQVEVTAELFQVVS